MHRLRTVGLILVAWLATSAGARAKDWPQFRGPRGDGIAREAGLSRSWAEDEPRVLWRRPLGEGFSGISVVGDRLYTLFAEADNEVAAGFRVADGSEVWRRRIGKKFLDHWGNGPRATPAVDGDTLYVLSSNGALLALRAQDGAVIWRIDLEAEFGNPNRPTRFDEGAASGDVPLGPYWGFCSSPLIEGDLLIVFTGAGNGSSLVAFDKHSGETRWRRFDHMTSYNSPSAVTIGGERQIVVAMSNEIVSVTTSGDVIWRHPWARYGVSQPAFLPPDKLFFSSANDVGAVLLAVPGAGGDGRVEEVWREPRMRNSWQSSVAYQGSILGFDNATLKMLSASGETRWAKRGLGKGSLVLADDLLFVLSDHGVLTLAEWSTEGFRQTGRVEILSGVTMTAPTLAGGKLFLRDQEIMVSLDLAGPFQPLAQPPTAGADVVSVDTRSAEQAIAKSVEALGGEAAWRAIDTLELAGRYTSFSQTEPFLLRRKRPDLYRFDHHESTFKLTVAYDGQTAWWHTGVPLFSNASWPVEMPRPYQGTVKAEAELEPPFIAHRDKGHVVEWVGEGRFDGKQYLELRIRRHQDLEKVERWFLDPGSFLPVLRLSRGTYHGYDTEQISYLADYREVAGVLLPHRVETELGNDFLVLEVERARANLEIDDAVFARPLPVGMEHLRSLAGHWRVEIESLDDPAVHTERLKSWTRDETVSVIHSRSGGSLLEEEIAVATGRPRQVRRLISYDRFREVYRIAHFDTFGEHLDILEGKLVGGRLELTNLKADTSTRIYQTTLHTREILHDLQPDSFKLDREISSDGGEHWLPAIRFVYSRSPEGHH